MNRMHARFFFTANDGELVSRLIQRITGSAWAHVGVVFSTHGTPHDLRKDVYFESRITKFDGPDGKRKNGLRGPRDFRKILEWAAESPKHRYTLRPIAGYLPITDAEAMEMYNRLSAGVHTISYAPLQIAQNWVAQRLGIRIGFGRGDNGRWTCSETCLRVLPARVWPYYDIPNITANQITPAGRKMASIMAGTEAWISDCGVEK